MPKHQIRTGTNSRSSRMFRIWGDHRRLRSDRKIHGTRHCNVQQPKCWKGDSCTPYHENRERRQTLTTRISWLSIEQSAKAQMHRSDIRYVCIYASGSCCGSEYLISLYRTYIIQKRSCYEIIWTLNRYRYSLIKKDATYYLHKNSSYTIAMLNAGCM